MNKFKVGDKVKIVRLIEPSTCYSKMKKDSIGKIGIVEKVYKDLCSVQILDTSGGGYWAYHPDCLEFIPTYQTKSIKGYPEWLKDVPRGEAVLCNVWGDEEYTTRAYVTAYLGKNVEYPYRVIPDWYYKHAEPVVERNELDELKAKYQELGNEIRKLERG